MLWFVYVKQSAVMFHNDCVWKLMTVITAANNAQQLRRMFRRFSAAVATRREGHRSPRLDSEGGSATQQL